MSEKQYDNTNRGVLFRGEKKTDKHPDYTGSINVGGQDFWLSAWIRKDKNNKPYMSLNVKLKDEQPQTKPAQQQDEPFDADDIPF